MDIFKSQNDWFFWYAHFDLKYIFVLFDDETFRYGNKVTAYYFLSKKDFGQKKCSKKGYSLRYSKSLKKQKF